MANCAQRLQLALFVMMARAISVNAVKDRACCTQARLHIQYPGINHQSDCTAPLSQLVLVAHNRFFAANAVIADSRETADSLMIVSRGLVEICLPMKEGGTVLRVLQRG
jgi:CRP-like cAMP-binding protein